MSRPHVLFVRRVVLGAAIAILGWGFAQSPGSGSVSAADVTAAIEQLERLVTATLEASGVPGLAIAVVHEDEVVYLGGFGVRDVDSGAPVDADTVFQLASVSKPIATTVVAALVGQGVVSWDDRIADLLPGFALMDPLATDEVTLRDMFAHRSGLPDHAGDLLEDIGYGRQEVLRRLRYQPPDSSFRAGYAYTNFGFTAAAEAAARAAGTTWEELSADVLYRPLGMTSTSSRFADFASAENRAATHELVDGAYVPLRTRDSDAQSPAGGVSSSVRDMAQWLRLQLGGGAVDGVQVVASEPLAETHWPQVQTRVVRNPETDRPAYYGLGWNVGIGSQPLRIGHSGAFEMGAATAVRLVPSERLGIVVLTNAAPVGVAEAMAESFLDLALHGEVLRDYVAILATVFAQIMEPPYGSVAAGDAPPADASPALPAEHYVGTYHNDFVGDATVEAVGGELVLHLGPDRRPFPLTHWDRDVFTYQPDGENAYGPSTVAFTIGPDRRAVGLTIEIFEVHGVGRFALAGEAPGAPQVARRGGGGEAAASSAAVTRLRIFTPSVAGTVATGVDVLERVEGSCFERSLASPERPDALRCTVADAIVDPCFLDVMAQEERLLCAESPFEPQVVLLTPTGPLPTGSAEGDPDYLGAQPWALVLEGGRRCTLLTGATAPIAGMRIEYGCDDGSSVVGPIDRTLPVWHVFHHAGGGAPALERLAVVDAWF